MHWSGVKIGQGIGKGHSLRESGKEGLFPVPGTQSDFRRIIDNNCIYVSPNSDNTQIPLNSEWKCQS